MTFESFADGKCHQFDGSICPVMKEMALVMRSVKYNRAHLSKIRAFGDDRPILSFFVIDTFKLSDGGRALRVRRHL